MEKAFVVGIAGGSSSGKTTFCSALEKALSKSAVKTFHMDSYFKPEKDRPYSAGPMTGNMYVDDNHPLTMDLPKLNEDLSEAIDGNLFDVILVEGLLTLWDKNIYSKLDLKLYVDCPPDERIVRRLKRNMQWGQSFDQIANVYLDLVRYRHNEYVEPTKWRADFILNGTMQSEQALSILSEYIVHFAYNKIEPI